MRKPFYILIALMVVFILLISACAPAATPTEAPEKPAAEEPAAEEPAAEEPAAEEPAAEEPAEEPAAEEPAEWRVFRNPSPSIQSEMDRLTTGPSL